MARQDQEAAAPAGVLVRRRGNLKALGAAEAVALADDLVGAREGAEGGVEPVWTRDWVETEARSRAETPEKQLLAIFDAFDEWFHQDDFEGCSFINVMLELADRDHPVGRASVLRLANIRSFLTTLANEAGLREPETFAHSWHILMRGSSSPQPRGTRTPPSAPSRWAAR